MAENTLRERNDASETPNSNRSPEISEGVFLQKFGKEYIEHGKLSGNEKNELIEEIMTKDSLVGTKAKTALEKFRASNDLYGHINLEKIDIFMLQKQVAKSYLMLQKTRQRFESLALKDYDIDGKIFQKKIAPKLKEKTEKEILQMLKYESKMQDFLKNALGNIPSRREKITVLAGFSESMIQKRIAKMSDTEKKDVIGVLSKIQNGNIPNDFDIRTLVTSSLFEGPEKIDFVHTYIPFINLAQAVEIGIITEPDADKKRKAFVDEVLSDSNISTENKKLLRVQITNDDVELATRDVVKDENGAMKVSKEIGFEAFEKDVSAAYDSELQRIKMNGPGSFEDLKKMLSEINRDARFENIALLGEDKIVKISKKTSTGEEVSYIQITGIDDQEKKFSFRVIGSEAINFENPGDVMDVEYAVFYENLRNAGQTRLSIFSRDTIEQKMHSGEIASNELQLKKDTSSFEGDAGAQLRNEMKASKIASLEKEISDLNAKIASEEYASQKSENESEKAKLEREKERLQSAEFSPAEAQKEYNKQEFLKKLNEIDPSGSPLGFGPGVAFTYTDDKGLVGVYTIRKFDGNKISLNDRQNYYKDISLSDFFSAFKNWKAKRVVSIGTEEKLVKHFGDNFEFQNGKIIQKDAELNGVREEKTVEYLTNSKGKLIKIVSLGNGMVEFQEGKFEKESDHEDHGHGKGDHGHHHGPKEEKYILKLSGAALQKWTLDEFYQYIHSEKKDEAFTADWKTGQNYTERPLDPQNKTQGSFTDRFFRGMSLYEIMHGGHMVFEGIKEKLEHGSHAKSAHAALAMAKWLPKELRVKMRMKVEAAEAEETENAKKELGAIDSWEAVEQIEDWLLNRDTPQYKLEAGALFMMEKYGHLTAKKSGKDKDGKFRRGLYQYRGKFLWYERLGGRIGDELYNKVKKDAEAEGQSFTEEKLVHKLLKEQCNSEAHHYSGIHRRSRVHKEFENAWKSGVSGETEKGEKDANSFRSSTTMAKEGMGEIKGGTTTNGLAGWAHRAATKGTANNVKDYMLIPSAVLLSGAGYDIDQATYTQVKSFWDAGIPVIGFRMFGNTGLMDLFRNTVRDLSHEIGKAYPNKFPKIIEDAEKLHKAGTTRDGKEGDRLQMAEDFWNKYGEVLTRALHMSLASDVGSDTDFSKTDSIIKRKRNENSNFQKYYELVSAAVGEGDAFKDEYVDDWVGGTGFFGMNINEITTKYLQLDQGGGFRRGSPAEKVWDQIRKDINATPQKILVAGSSLNDTLNRTEQKKYLVETLREFVSAYMKLHGGNESALRALSRQTSSVGSQLRAWGIDVLGDLSNYSPEDILEGRGGAGKYIEQVADNIISGRTGENSGVSYDVPDILKKTKQGAYQATAANNNYNPLRDVA